MKKIFLLLLGIAITISYAYAAELDYFQVYKPVEGMTADQIMQIEYFTKYTKFAHDAYFEGKAYFVDKSGSVLQRDTLRERITLGKGGIAYKDLVMFTSPQVKGLAVLTWTYEDPNRDQDSWLWVPSLRKIRKISAANADDTFMGSDFTVEDISTRRFEDETYTLIGSENFKGYTSEYDKKTYFKDAPCFVIECKPKRANWYYSKRILWVDKNTGAGIYDEQYDSLGRKFKYIFKDYEIYKVNGKDYPAQVILEGKDLRTDHRTTIVNTIIKFEIGLSESLFTERTLTQSRW